MTRPLEAHSTRFSRGFISRSSPCVTVEDARRPLQTACTTAQWSPGSYKRRRRLYSNPSAAPTARSVIVLWRSRAWIGVTAPLFEHPGKPLEAHDLPSNVLSLYSCLSSNRRSRCFSTSQPKSPCMRETICSSTRQLASSPVIKSWSGPAARCSNAKVMPWGSQRPQSKRSSRHNAREDQ